MSKLGKGNRPRNKNSALKKALATGDFSLPMYKAKLDGEELEASVNNPKLSSMTYKELLKYFKKI